MINAFEYWLETEKKRKKDKVLIRHLFKPKIITKGNIYISRAISRILVAT